MERNNSQVVSGPTVNRQKCNALGQVALAEAVNDFESTELGAKLPMIINTVEFQDFMDKLVKTVKNDSFQQFFNTTYNRYLGNETTSNNSSLNEAMKQKIHNKIFELGGIGVENLTAIKEVGEMTSEQAAGVTIRNTIGSTSGSFIDSDENHSEQYSHSSVSLYTSLQHGHS